MGNELAEDEPRVRPTLGLTFALLKIDRHFVPALRRAEILLGLAAASCGCFLARATHGDGTYFVCAAIVLGLAAAGLLYRLTRIARRHRQARSDAFIDWVGDVKRTKTPAQGRAADVESR
ncbi:hypothetical protein ACFV9C_41775 [Kribbella sp. NPDC059898]|uniref:hypothetical protein n=1 Tax=Kribbella sp. NPDC059898 TaxID=3346995 RepID=UPI00365440E1